MTTFTAVRSTRRQGRACPLSAARLLQLVRKALHHRRTRHLPWSRSRALRFALRTPDKWRFLADTHHRGPSFCTRCQP